MGESQAKLQNLNHCQPKYRDYQEFLSFRSYSNDHADCDRKETNQLMFNDCNVYAAAEHYYT